jgi:hypothetical protein
MNFKPIYLIQSIIFFLILFISCTNKNLSPRLPYSDEALLDSASNKNYKYYKNKPDTLWSGIHGPHGTFKLRFNSVAYKALTDAGKLPVGSVFPEGSFIIKDVYKDNAISFYAWMYKRKSAWIWGEAFTNGEFIIRAKDGQNSCAGCHSQTGNRDLAVTFKFY